MLELCWTPAANVPRVLAVSLFGDVFVPAADVVLIGDVIEATTEAVALNRRTASVGLDRSSAGGPRYRTEGA